MNRLKGKRALIAYQASPDAMKAVTALESCFRIVHSTKPAHQAA